MIKAVKALQHIDFVPLCQLKLCPQNQQPSEWTADGGSSKAVERFAKSNTFHQKSTITLISVRNLSRS